MKKYGFYFITMLFVTTIASCDLLPPLITQKAASKQRQSVSILSLPQNVQKIVKALFKGLLKDLTSFKIPNSVKEIEKEAFSDNKLQNIDIPDAVIKIAAGAFKNNKLTSLNFGTELKTIGINAFANNKLSEVTIPHSVTSIETGAFIHNPLTKVTLPQKLYEQFIKNNKLTAIFGKSTEIQYINSSTQKQGSKATTTIPNSNTQKQGSKATTTIPNSNTQKQGSKATTTIPSGVSATGSSGAVDYFPIDQQKKDIKKWNTLTELVISKDVSKFPNDILWYKNLKKITFESPSQIQKISTTAISGTETLVSIDFPSSIKSIELNAVSGNKLLTSVTFQTPSKLGIINSNAFSHNPKLASITIPSSVEIIQADTFSNNAALKTVTFENGSILTHISPDAFKNSPVTKVYLEQKLYDSFQNSFKNIFSNVEYYDVNNKSTKLQTKNRAVLLKPPKTKKTSKGIRTTYYNANRVPIRVELIVNNGITTIDKSEYIKQKLTAIDLKNVQIIGDSAFAKNQLTTIDLKNVQIIGDSAFAENQLTTIDLKNVQTIGDKAFASNRLTIVVIPDSVKIIGEKAFSTLPSISLGGGGWFKPQKNEITSLTIGKNVQKIGKRAFAENKLKKVTIPNSVTTIGDGAFTDNPLTKVTLPKKLYDQFVKNKKLTAIFGKSTGIQYIDFATKKHL